MADDGNDSAEARSTMRRLRHALRTPIGQIVGYSELLQDEAAATGQEGWVADLERIRGAGLALLGLVDEILGGEPGAPPEPEAAGAAPAEAAGRAPALPDGRAGRLLVVDDEPANRDLMARRLRAFGYEVAADADGPAALRRLAAERFDLVLLDVMMPGMTGLEVLEAIRREHTRSELPVVLATALDGSADVVAGLRLGANDYVAKPLDFAVVRARIEGQLALKHANDEASRLARNLEVRNNFIRRVFGRYVSDEVVATLLEQPEALDLRGESREVTVLTADLRGFSSLTADCAPSDVLVLLNHYLGAMSEVIQAHDGIIDDFVGDGILAFFGAPIEHPDHGAQAVRCAVAMQLALGGVNRVLRGRGLPELEMGIGIDTGEVIVGSMGSEKRSKYGAIGLPLNLASRIESCTLGGEVLVSERVLEAARGEARVDLVREIHPKGFEAPLRVHRVVGVHGREDLQLSASEHRLVSVADGLAVEVAPLEGKSVGRRALPGVVRALSATAARIECGAGLAEMTDVRVAFLEGSGGLGLSGSCYAKVVACVPGPPAVLTVRFTARPSRLIAELRRVLASLS